MIEQALYSLLTADAGIAALVGTRVYPAPAPEGTASPYVTYQRVDTPRDRNLDGPTGLAQPRFQVDCWAEREQGGSYAAAADLANRVRLALDGFRGIVGLVDVRSIALADERDDFDVAAAAWRRSLDFQLWHCEER